jgi:hypothetical protein
VLECSSFSNFADIKNMWSLIRSSEYSSSFEQVLIFGSSHSFDSPETAVDSTAPAPPCSSDRWHDIDDFSETAPCLPPTEQGASTPDSLHTPSRPSSEPLHDRIGGVDLHPRRARSEATTSSSARPRSPPPRHTRTSLETQLSEEGRLYTGRGVTRAD